MTNCAKIVAKMPHLGVCSRFSFVARKHAIGLSEQSFNDFRVLRQMADSADESAKHWNSRVLERTSDLDGVFHAGMTAGVLNFIE